MRWTPGRRSHNLEDRRAESPRRMRFPLGGRGGGVRIPLPRGRTPRLSLGGLLLLAYLFRGDLLAGSAPGGGQVSPPGGFPSAAPGGLPEVGAGRPAATTPAEERRVDFVSFDRRRPHPEHLGTRRRVRWFRRGLEIGVPRQCDTFGGASS